MTNKKALKLFIPLLFVLLLCALCSCKEADSVSLSEKGMDNYKIPHISGLSESNPANKVLEDFFTDINDKLKIANNEGLMAWLAYSLEQTDDYNYSLNSWVTSKDGEKLYLPQIQIMKTSVNVPDKSFAYNLSDRNFVEKMLFLAKNGYEAELDRLDSEITLEQICMILSIYYEDKTGTEIDISQLSHEEINSIPILKMIAVNPNFSSHITKDEPIKMADLLDIISGFLPRLNFDAFGLSSQSILFKELLSMLSTYHEFFSFIFEEGSGEGAKWEDFGKAIVGLEVIENVVEEDGDGLSRAEIADSLAFIHKEYFYTEEISTELSDSEDKDDIYCAAHGIMSFFPKHNMFNPSYIAKYFQLPEIGYKFISTSYDACNNGNEGEYLSLKAVLSALRVFSDYCNKTESFGHEKQNPKNTYRVVNDRDYDWYLRQHDTGEYAGVNCMPTMSAMAILWANKTADVTPEELRNAFLAENDKGWWLAQVMESLSMKDVEYNYGNVGKESIMECLDRGGIVLAMISEAPPDEQGHCEIIYGYIKTGDSIQFLVHDPGFSDSLRADGSPYGKGRHLDSDYVVWTMNRINHIFIEVLADQTTEGLDINDLTSLI